MNIITTEPFIKFSNVYNAVHDREKEKSMVLALTSVLAKENFDFFNKDCSKSF